MQASIIIQNELENFIRRHLLPNIQFTITDKWSGIMAMGLEKAPVIKECSNRVFCCVRMSGMGVALAPIAARQVVALMEK